MENGFFTVLPNTCNVQETNRHVPLLKGECLFYFGRGVAVGDRGIHYSERLFISLTSRYGTALSGLESPAAFTWNAVGSGSLVLLFSMVCPR